MDVDRVDPLIVFAATGDLAKLETFPALVGLVERRGNPTPVGAVSRRGARTGGHARSP
jgi:glucose-6-phosphate 1-dehydrogenase